jgi:CMP-N,N'-diacetyllegionaminic acid synthase
MLNGKSILAVIPARGGSKGIFKKNIALLGDLPLVAWTILAAKQSGLIDCIHVSTDDEEIAEVSQKYGADIPFLRPKSLSTDISSTYDTLEYTIGKYETLNKSFDIVIELQPTYPFRLNELIAKCLNSFVANPECKSLITLVKTQNTLHSDYSVRLTDNRINFKGMPSEFRRQNITPEYSFHGIFICTYLTDFRKNKSICDKENTFGFVVTEEIETIDINSDFDLFLANQTIKFYGIESF